MLTNDQDCKLLKKHIVIHNFTSQSLMVDHMVYNIFFIDNFFYFNMRKW